MQSRHACALALEQAATKMMPAAMRALLNIVFPVADISNLGRANATAQLATRILTINAALTFGVHHPPVNGTHLVYLPDASTSRRHAFGPVRDRTRCSTSAGVSGNFRTLKPVRS